MLQNINLHIHADESVQTSIEKNAAEDMIRLQHANFEAFQRTMPSLAGLIKAEHNKVYAVFFNKYSELNISHLGTGRVFYGEHPELEIKRQVQEFLLHPLSINLNAPTCERDNDTECLSSLAAKTQQADSIQNKSLDVVVVFGLGLGHHIKYLLESCSIKHLVVYEPEIDFFSASMFAVSWKECFDIAKRKKTAIYLQIGKDGRDLYADITELRGHFNVTELFLYRHYSHIVYNQVIDALLTTSWADFKQWVVRPNAKESVDNYVKPFSPPLPLDKWQQTYLNRKRFDTNIEALKRFFPDIAQEFQSYKPHCWQPLADCEGTVNVVHKQTLNSLYSESPLEEGAKIYECFMHHPNANQLVLGYRGDKLKQYYHYQLVNELETLLEDDSDLVGELPSTIKSIIVFGAGVGYELANLVDNHDVKRLFLCEPNKDFFYSSLYAIDWSSLLTKLYEKGATVYLNVGDDGSHLAEDLIFKFHSFGTYLLADTYFYQPHYNAQLLPAIVQLKEQLRSIVSMGDYFDHAKYGIAHTRWAIEQGIPFLRKDVSTTLSIEEKDVPVFIVGNGPSLDGLITLIKEHQDDVIIISCGTALQSLQRNGITPDFHAEIEMNRGTFDWASKIGEPDYLKSINLISCNGIHPDTCALYKSVYLAFKTGESSTVSCLSLCEPNTFVTLDYAYPTVTNFVMDFVATVGFSQVYLIGIDMGFVDKQHHHSKSSGYYKNSGEEVYDYSKVNDTSLTTEGNFRPIVNTKYEFRLSKSVLEKRIRTSSRYVYNLNDGAKIAGATPLYPENVLIVPGVEKKTVLSALCQQGFEAINKTTFNQRWNQRFSHTALLQEIEVLRNLLTKPIETVKDAESIIELQRDCLVSSFQRKRSVLFYYLNGTLNFFNSVLSQILRVGDDEEKCQKSNRAIELWKHSLTIFETLIEKAPDEYDTACCHVEHRRQKLLSQYAEKNPFSVAVFPKRKSYILSTITLPIPKCPDAYSENFNLIFWQGEEAQHHISKLKTKYENAKICIIVCNDTDFKYVTENYDHSVVYLPGDFENPIESHLCNDKHRLEIAFLAVLSRINGAIILPKLVYDENEIAISHYYGDITRFEKYYCYENPHYLLFTERLLDDSELINIAGDRLRYIPILTDKLFIHPTTKVWIKMQQFLKDTVRDALVEPHHE